MPTSALGAANTVVWFVEEVKVTRILDVGPGHGKYGLLLREYLNRDIHIDAVEAWPDYIEKFAWMPQIYDNIYIEDICDTPTEKLAEYDMILMIDIIEHLEKSRGLALLDRMPGWVVINTPTKFFTQDASVPTEAHLSLWNLDDFGQRVHTSAIVDESLIVRLKPKD